MAFVADISIGLDSAAQLRDILIDNTPQWSIDGWGGYSAAVGPVFFLLFITPKLTLEEAQQSMKPVSDYVISLNNGTLSVPIELQIQTVANYWEYFNTDIAQALGQMNGQTTLTAS